MVIVDFRLGSAVPYLPDRNRTAAVLIGVSRYESLPQIPAVQNNIEDLAELLSEPGLGLFAHDRCVVLANPAATADVGRSLQHAADTAEDLLLVYYAGHGLVASDGELHLGLPSTTHDQTRFTAMPYGMIREIIQRSRARVVLVILDCCFSGRAVGAMSGSDMDIAGMSEVSGTFVLASSSPTSLSLARPGDPYTAFTGELIRILKEGISGESPYLTLTAIYQELRRRLTALAYPVPTVQAKDAAGNVCLARNPAAWTAIEHDLSVNLASGERVGDDSYPSVDEQLTPADVDWATDEPSKQDLLHRGFLADVVALRLLETQTSTPDTTFCVHIDGPWGSGKSTLLNLLSDRLTPACLVIRFDAWQQARLSPTWWSLMTAMRRAIVGNRAWWSRPLLRCQEVVVRARRTGAPYLLAVVLIAALAAVLGYFLWPAGATAKSLTDNAKALGAAAAVLGTFWAGSLVVSRFLLWDTAPGARLFEKSQENPLGDVAAHFRWLLTKMPKPVVFFVDDLDRCEDTYVVEFLETIQTLIRARTDGTARSSQSAHFVIAADGAWLRRSYESTYARFADCVAEPGKPLGYLFLDKIFQLTLPMPVLAGSSQRVFLDNVLHVADPETSDSSTETAESLERRTGNPNAIQQRLQQFAEGRARQAVELLTNPGSQQRTEHYLRKFAPLLGSNPRSVKKFINTFAVLRSIRTLEENFIDNDTLALWALLRARWPGVAGYLEAHPDAVKGILEPIWCDDHFPDTLRHVVASPDLRAIVVHQPGGPLTAERIRQCCGVAAE